MSTASGSNKPLDPGHGPDLWLLLLVSPFATLGIGLAFSAISGGLKSLGDLNASRPWGGLMVLSLAPILLTVLQYRIRGYASPNCMLIPVVGVRMVISIGAGQSWLANLSIALSWIAVVVFIQVPLAYFARHIDGRGMKSWAQPKSPMWDADADNHLAAKGPI